MEHKYQLLGEHGENYGIYTTLEKVWERMAKIYQPLSHYRIKDLLQKPKEIMMGQIFSLIVSVLFVAACVILPGGMIVYVSPDREGMLIGGAIVTSGVAMEAIIIYLKVAFWGSKYYSSLNN